MMFPNAALTMILVATSGITAFAPPAKTHLLISSALTRSHHADDSSGRICNSRNNAVTMTPIGGSNGCRGTADIPTGSACRSQIKSVHHDGDIQELTDLLLDTKMHPPGTLSLDVLNKALAVCHSWAKTCSTEGALTVEQIVNRVELEREAGGGQGKTFANKFMYTTVIDAWARSGNPNAATRAEEVLTHMEHLYESGLNRTTKPNSVSYNTVINAWCKQAAAAAAATVGAFPVASSNVVAFNKYSSESGVGNSASQPTASVEIRAATYAQEKAAHAAYRAELILQRMIDLSTSSHNNGNDSNHSANHPHDYAGPNTISYNNVIAAYARCGNGRKAEELLKRMVTFNQENDDDVDDEYSIHPDVISYNSVIDAWSRSGERGAAERAESILNMMVHLQDENPRRGRKRAKDRLRPDALSYTGVIFAYTRSNTETSAKRAEHVLEQMEAAGIIPDAFVYNAVLDAHAKNSGRESEGALLAENILKRMERIGNVNTVSYNTVINAWGKSGSRGTNNSSNNNNGVSTIATGLAAEKLLKRVEEEGHVKPDVVTYTTVIDAITRSGEERAAERGEAILERMLHIQNDECKKRNNSGVKPNTVTLNSILYAYSTSGEADAAKKAEAFLKKMEKMYNETGDEMLKPNTISYTTVIDAYARAQSVDAAMDAERIFQRMEEVYTNGNTNAKPNVHSFNTVINAWVKSSKPGSPARAEEILDKMLELYERGIIDAGPNVVTFTTVMNGWARSAESGSAQRAERIFRRMEQHYKAGHESAKPNPYSYTALIDGWNKSRDPGSVQHAEKIFHRLHEDFKKGTSYVPPNAIQVTQIMHAWSKSGDSAAGERAENLLCCLENLYNEYKYDSMRPTALSYTTAINAWAKARQFGKARRAKGILERMIAAYEGGNVDAKPNVFAYTAVLSACAFSVGDIVEERDALNIASDTYKELCASEYDVPNHITYATFLRVCINLIPSGQAQFVSIASVFKQCCLHGQVNELVLRLLGTSLPWKQLQDLVPCNVSKDGTVRMEDVPAEWKRNMKEVDRKRKPRPVVLRPQGSNNK